MEDGTPLSACNYLPDQGSTDPIAKTSDEFRQDQKMINTALLRKSYNLAE
jgi:hypothetical protein